MMGARVEQRVVWRPNPGPQTKFLASRAQEALYAGSAGGGKSIALIACPMRWAHNPNYRGLYLRRESAYLGDAIDKSRKIYPALGGVLVQSPRIEWRFPSGATLWMGHCAHENDVANYDSFEFSEVLFDELTHFTEKQYLGIRARLRGTDPTLPYWSRAASNPGGPGHDWVFARFAAWLDPESSVQSASGQTLFYRGDEISEPGDELALSRMLIGAKLADNPHIPANYLAKLQSLDPVRKAQLADGNWLKKAAPKDFWDRTRLQYFDACPPKVIARVRCWDFAATATGDWTVGTRLALTLDRLVLIEHMVRFRGPPNVVRATFKATAEADQKFDPDTTQWIPQDPGQAGVDQVASYQASYPLIPIRSRRPTGDKITRFRPASARALSGNAGMVRGSWNSVMHDELEAVPQHATDDIMDTVSDGYAVLNGYDDEDEAPIAFK